MSYPNDLTAAKAGKAAKALMRNPNKWRVETYKIAGDDRWNWCIVSQYASVYPGTIGKFFAMINRGGTWGHAGDLWGGNAMDCGTVFYNTPQEAIDGKLQDITANVNTLAEDLAKVINALRE
jgi:hypothetical protein